MGARSKYKKKPTALITAVQLNLDFPGFTYHKWGGEQRCRRGDWLVDNHGDVYTVERDTFERTYAQVSPGVYRKETVVWAEVADEAGSIETNEGVTTYSAGDYIVYNNEDGTDGYAVSAKEFEEMYDAIPDESPGSHS